MMDATYTTVIRLYEQGLSMRVIVHRLDLSFGKVRKILITAGLYESELYKQIKPLLRQGLTVPEIAARLERSESTINAHLPYNKGMYNKEYPTKNAMRIKKCRANSHKEEK